MPILMLALKLYFTLSVLSLVFVWTLCKAGSEE